MKQYFLKMTTLAVTAFMASTLTVSADTTSLSVGVGYRQDSMTLNIKERGNSNPRARLNRHFKDLEIALIEGKFKSTLGCSEAYVRAAFDYGFLVDGRVRDQLCVEDRFELHNFHHAGVTVEGDYLNTVVHNDVKSNSDVWDADIAFAYPMHYGCDQLVFAPAVGFTYNRQNIRVKKRSNFQDYFYASSPSSDDYDSFFVCQHKSNNFRTSWWGPYLGFDFVYDSPDCWNLYGAFEFHFGRARRQVKSTTDRIYVDNYSRTKSFYGPKFVLGTTYMFCQNWFADANISYQKFFSNAERDHLAWSTGSIRLDVGYTF